MKQKARSIISFVVIALMFSLYIIPATATAPANVEVTYFEDGSYLTTELVILPSTVRANHTVTGQRTATYTNASGEKQWALNGTTSSAVSANYTHAIYNSAWSAKSTNAYCSGNQAIADGTFSSGLIVSKNLTVILSCSPSGVLS